VVTDASQEIRPTIKNLLGVRTTVPLAEKMAAVLGAGAVLQREMPQDQASRLRGDYHTAMMPRGRRRRKAVFPPSGK